MVADKEWDELFGRGRKLECPPGEVILRKGDTRDRGGVLRVVSGWAVVTDRHRDGSVTTLELRGARQLLGETAALGRRLRNADVHAVTRITAEVVSCERFRSYVQGRNHLLVELFLDGLGERRAANLRAGLRSFGVASSLSRLLLDLARHSGSSTVEGIPQKVIAGLLGVTTRTVRTEMSRLVNCGAVIAQWPVIKITDESVLREMARAAE